MKLQLNKRGLLNLILALNILLLIVSRSSSLILSVPAGLVFGTFMPGFMLLLGIKHKLDFSWQTMVYAIGLGIICDMALGLAVNLMRPLGIVKAPLQTAEVLWVTLLFNYLLCLGWRRWNDHPFSFTLPKFSLEDKAVVSVSVLILLLSIAGVERVNNGASGSLVVTSYLAVPLLFVYLYLRSAYMMRGVAICAMWLSGLSLLLSGWLRSNFVSGPDISLEYEIAKLVKSHGYWSIGLYHNAYTACLSVSLLPVLLAIFTKLSLTFVFKFAIPLLYSFTICTVYLIAHKYFRDKGALAAAFFFISQPVFSVWWWIPIRQEIAFSIFSLIILSVSSTSKKTRGYSCLLLILGVGLIIAHYSTASLAIALLLIIWLLKSYCSRRFRFLDVPVISINVLFALCLGYFLWYSQLTYGFTGITAFVSKSVQNVTHLASGDSQSNGQGLLSQFSIAAKTGTSDESLGQYIVSTTSKSSRAYGANNVYHSDNSDITQVDLSPQSTMAIAMTALLRNIVIALGKIVVILSVVALVFVAIKQKALRTPAIIASSALTVIGAGIIVPFFSLAYDQVRTFQQMLIAIGGVYGIVLVTPRHLKRVAELLLAIFLVAYFVLVSNSLNYFNNSPNVPAAFKNYGYDYWYYYVNASDAKAAKWLNDAYSSGPQLPIFGDSDAGHRLRIESTPSVSESLQSPVVPSALPKSSFVYVDSMNLSTKSGVASINGGVILYSYPFDFLNSNKDRVYTNGSAEIYR